MRLPAALGLKKATAGRRVVSPRGPVNSGLRGGVASRVITPWDWIFAPALMSFALTIVLATPFKLFGLYLPEPVSPLILAFVWPLIRPSFIAPFVLGALGLFLDAFWGAPMGFWMLDLMLVYGVLLMARSYIIGQDTVVVFGIFLLAEFLFFLFGVLAMSLYASAVPRLWGVFEQMIATTFLFPFALILLDRYVQTDVKFM